jgi:hypothetical protein
VATRRRSGSFGIRAQGKLSFSGSKIARRQISKRGEAATCRIARRQPWKGAPATCGGEKGGRRAVGASQGRRWCSADLRDRSAEALDVRSRPRVVARKEKRGAKPDGGSGARGSGRNRLSLASAPDRDSCAKVHSASAAPKSLGGRFRTEARPCAVKEGGRRRREQRITSVGFSRACRIAQGRRPRAVARKDSVGAKLGWRQRRARLGTRPVVTRLRSGWCDSCAQGPLSFSGSKIAQRQHSN